MEKRVVWSPEAAEDLESIAEYIARDSGFYASAVVTKILDVASIKYQNLKKLEGLYLN